MRKLYVRDSYTYTEMGDNGVEQVYQTYAADLQMMGVWMPIYLSSFVKFLVSPAMVFSTVYGMAMFMFGYWYAI